MNFTGVSVEADSVLPSSDVLLFVSKMFLDEVDVRLGARLLAVESGGVGRESVKECLESCMRCIGTCERFKVIVSNTG